MRFWAPTRPRWRALLELVLLLVVAIAPTVQFVCDALPGEAHPGNHVHAGPALVVQGISVPVVLLSGAPLPPSRHDVGAGVGPAVFVPPRA